jgi:glycosyltransferase involved in cell wall biosynthesis
MTEIQTSRPLDLEGVSTGYSRGKSILANKRNGPRLRIAQISPLCESVPPKLYGGTERVVSYLTEALVHLGHDVTLFASADSRTAARLVPCCPSALRLDGGCVDQLPHHLIMLEEVLRRSDEFDILHFHIDYLHFGHSRRHALTQVTTLHGRLDIPDLVPLYREFSEMPVISISHSQQKPLLHANWVGTVHHGLPVNLYREKEDPGNYLAFLGRISPEKRVDRAIEIALRSEMPLKIAAKVDNVDKDYFNTTIRPLLDHSLIDFIGEIGEGEKEDFLGGAHALLFPIDWPEPFGLVMIEAMACGTPVIAWPNGSIPEIIEDGVSGFLVESIDEAVAAVEKINSLSRHRCREEFERRFSALRMAADYVRLYGEHLSIGGRPQHLRVH